MHVGHVQAWQDSAWFTAVWGVNGVRECSFKSQKNRWRSEVCLWSVYDAQSYRTVTSVLVVVYF